MEKNLTRRWLPFLLVFVLAGLVSPRPAAAAPPTEPYASATECARCHQAIHVYWSESEHVRSATKPAFLESLRRAVESATDRDAVQRGCVSCHAPTTLASGTSPSRCRSPEKA